MLDNTKQLHQEVDFVVVENLIVELLIVAVVVVLFDPRRKEDSFCEKDK
jgi:competence protein ComGC